MSPRERMRLRKLQAADEKAKKLKWVTFIVLTGSHWMLIKCDSQFIFHKVSMSARAFLFSRCEDFWQRVSRQLWFFVTLIEYEQSMMANMPHSKTDWYIMHFITPYYWYFLKFVILSLFTTLIMFQTRVIFETMDHKTSHKCQFFWKLNI